jgi:hypothetical protein
MTSQGEGQKGRYNQMSKTRVVGLVLAAAVAGTVWPYPADAVVPKDTTGSVTVAHHKVTASKKTVRRFQDNWDAWDAYNRTFTDGCWHDFVTSDRRLTRSTDDLTGERSRLHRGWWWDFGLGEGCN